MERMAESIRKVVCAKVAREHSPLPGAMVTINRVDVSKDFGNAKIFFSIFGGNVSEGEAQDVLNSQQGVYRHEISKKLNFRHTPKIEFCFDKNTDYAFKIEKLLSGNP